MLRANVGYVIVRVTANADVSPGGIVLPGNAVEKSNKGVVIDHTTEYSSELLLPGTVVYFPLYAGHEVTYKGAKLLVLKEDVVLAYEVDDYSE